MEALLAFIAIAVAALNLAAKAAKSGGRSEAKSPAPRRDAPTPIGQISEKRRAQMRDSLQWRAARQKQDDAEQLHSVHMDSCESRLESLRVLHDAGILDNEEYAQRVARVKAKHAAGGRP